VPAARVTQEKRRRAYGVVIQRTGMVVLNASACSCQAAIAAIHHYRPLDVKTEIMVQLGKNAE
jgi:hypothetical protein